MHNTPHTPHTTIRRVRTTTVSLALAAVLAGGSVASAAPAFAKPDHAGKGAHAVADKPGKADKGDKREKGEKSSKADKDARKLARTVAQVERRLANAVKESRLAGLTEADVTAILANVELDRAALAGFTSWKDVKALRVSSYVVVVNYLRQAAEIAAALDALQVVDPVVVPEPDPVVDTEGDPVVVEPETDPVVVEPETDPVVVDTEGDPVVVEPETDPVVVEPETDPVSDARATLEAAVEALRAVTAQTDRVEVREAKELLSNAQVLLDELLGEDVDDETETETEPEDDTVTVPGEDETTTP